MKNILLILSLIFLIINTTVGQKILIKDDEFTGDRTERTSVEKLISKGLQPSVLKYSFLKDKNSIVFDARVKLNGGNTVFAIGEGFEIIFLMVDGEKVVVKAIESIVSERGGGGFFGSEKYGATIYYAFENNNDINKLKNVKINKVRVYTDEGYFEKKVAKKDAIKLSKCAELITSE